MTAIVLRGDARHLPLPDASVDLICTSPPYFGLRSYTDGGEHYDGQIGSEATPAEFLAALLDCTREWVRVLKPSGSLFVNLGDKYAGSTIDPRPRPPGPGLNNPRNSSMRAGKRIPPPITDLRPKSLLGLPWRYALACTDQLGLILRAEIVWNKPNGLPESVTDRVRRSHEQLFHFTRLPRYFAAVDEIREPHQDSSANRSAARHGGGNPNYGAGRRGDAAGKSEQYVTGELDDLGVRRGFAERRPNPLGKLPGSVWTIPSAPLKVPAHLGIDHFAAFPPALVRPIVLGWSPAGICTRCGEGRRPVRGVDWTQVPHTITEKRALTASETAGWCADFADWCDLTGISRQDLDAAAGTSDMGGWWASRLPHRAAVPTPEQWSRLRAKFDPPSHFHDLVNLTRPVPTAGNFGGDLDPDTGLLRRHRTGTGLTSTTAPPRTITGYACACPHPDAPTRPALVLDPFGGTGTTALVATVHGRTGITVDMSADYCRLAAWRTQDPGERARALDVPRPPVQLPGQQTLDDLFTTT